MAGKMDKRRFSSNCYRYWTGMNHAHVKVHSSLKKFGNWLQLPNIIFKLPSEFEKNTLVTKFEVPLSNAMTNVKKNFKDC